MSDLIKYVNSDIQDGIKYISVGLSNIITHVISTKEDYILNLTISTSMLRELMNFTIYRNFYTHQDEEYKNCYILQDEETSFIFKCGKISIEISQIETGFKFHLIK